MLKITSALALLALIIVNIFAASMPQINPLGMIAMDMIIGPVFLLIMFEGRLPRWIQLMMPACVIGGVVLVSILAWPTLSLTLAS